MHLKRRNAALLPVRWPGEAAEWDPSIIPHLRTSLLCRRSAVQSESSTARLLRSLAGCIQHTLPLTQNHGWRGRSRRWDPIPTDCECLFAIFFVCVGVRCVCGCCLGGWTSGSRKEASIWRLAVPSSSGARRLPQAATSAVPDDSPGCRATAPIHSSAVQPPRHVRLCFEQCLQAYEWLMRRCPVLYDGRTTRNSQAWRNDVERGESASLILFLIIYWCFLTMV